MVWLQEKPTPEAGDRFDLLPVIVNLTGVGRCGRRMLWLPGAESTLLPIVWHLQTLDASRILEEIAAGRAPRELLAWVSLMQNGNDDATIRRWLEIADLERDPQRKADLALVVVYAQLTDGVEVWEKALEGFNVMESVVLNKWMAQAKAQAVMGILEKKFPPVPVEVRAKVEATTSLDVLQSWVILAATAGSLNDFRRDAGI
jgi:hypothetical protein